MKKAPGEFDRHVGRRIRMRRIQVGMSQERLADSLGVTFQQVQKYEKGANRITMSRMRIVAQVLGVPMSYFSEGAPGEEGMVLVGGFAENKQADYTVELFSTPEGVALARAFASIEDPKVRRRVVDLVTTLAEGQRKE
ncbi:MAG: helix-turn-helix domain-containing protein [Rhabdaerophilum sp.]